MSTADVLLAVRVAVGCCWRSRWKAGLHEAADGCELDSARA
ncbi:hypothetical protein [Nocardia jiangsuensis]|uniref:Uncharacterized protein n=1 Tax=Nocardia jiangsuensis TaxID=1691563 RepID=A0ABV8DXS1_9NOCA